MSTKIYDKSWILSFISLTFFGFGLISSVSLIYNYIFNSDDFRGSDPISVLIFTFVFLSIYILSRSQYVHFGGILMIFLLTFVGFICGYKWGVLLPISLMIYVLDIVVASIIFTSGFGLVLTSVIAIMMWFTAYYQQIGIIAFDSRWKEDLYDIGDTSVIVIILFLVFLLSWIHSRKSEYALKKLADLNKDLEDKVAQRTEEVTKLQRERLLQISKFAEIGKFSSGIFHDLNNMLSALYINLERISMTSHEYSKDKKIKLIQDDIQSGLGHLDRITNFLVSFRKQYKETDKRVLFSPDKEILEVLTLVKHSLNEKKIKIETRLEFKHEFYGFQFRFFQIVKNLVCNSIEALDDVNDRSRNISVITKLINKTLVVEVLDNGVGIPLENTTKIFEPFFTTKGSKSGTGIGLSITSEIVQRDFKGTINVESELGKSTKFTVSLPINDRFI